MFKAEGRAGRLAAATTKTHDLKKIYLKRTQFKAEARAGRLAVATTDRVFENIKYKSINVINTNNSKV